ncbi:hypothetical protein CFOL_v3_05250 [Cephalotus follicularis]|uniref:60S ribosomal protein L18a-like protein n=1 Tax=Cephalotus follicularis TaxID=3775 RepID=A0A1Q3B1I9_CEPFO|nr:hypothetical protein CFOL_v3_05250 [Cephalotus follicularis]
MSSEGDKNRGVVVDHLHHHHEQQQPQAPQYGTFQGVANYPPQPAIGFPQPVPPPGHNDPPSVPPPYPPQYYSQGYQSAPVTGYAVAEGRPVRERRLPCCGIGFGWFLFIIGFFLGAIPWYIGLFILLCGRIDSREKPGYVACTLAAVVATVVIILGVTKGSHDW